MKNNKVNSVSLKFILTTLIALIITSTIYVIYKKQSNAELADLKVEENSQVKIAEDTQVVEQERVATSRGSVSRESTSREETKKESNKEKEVKTEEQIQEVAKQVVVESTKYTNIEDVKISKGMDLTKRTGLSREDFIKLIAGVKADSANFFEQNAGTIYDLCEKHQINEIFFCGLISAESGWNIAGNHRRTHNYISLMSGGKLLQFSSVEAGLEAAAKTLHNNYLTPGGKLYHGKTLAGVKTRFCPASSTWVDLVYGRMQQIV